MWMYALRRLVMTIPILLGVTIICFALVQIAPGDPVQNLVRPDANPEDVARLRAYYGLDQPVVVQYFVWLWRVLGGNFGMSTAAPCRLAWTSRSNR
jgi:peptide/nickel transport system permease protein